MDLHLIPGASATPEEREAVDGLLHPAPPPGTQHPAPEHPAPEHPAPEHPAPEHPAPAPSTQHPAPSTRSMLLPALHAVASRVGWISEGAINYICERLGIPPADAFGVASFYGLFSTRPRPPIVARVCDDIACRARGAESICASLERDLGPAGEAVLGGSAMWLRTNCLGQCDRPTAALFHVAGPHPRVWSETQVTAASVVEALRTTGRADQSYRPADAPQRTLVDAEPRRVLRRVGVANPESLNDYRAHGGYAALKRAFRDGADAVVRELDAAKLAGRGGAAYPTAWKWAAVARAQATPHYVVCNADESEPGTFKDRVLMEEDPFAIVEALTIAGFVVGANRGFIYLRAEYPLAAARLEGALSQARSAGLLGANVLNSGLAFDIEIRRGAGAYICGEETALFNSIEGYRGEPRSKPPFPVDVGLFGKPTLVNNVETLVSVLDVIVNGAAQFTAVGTPSSAGTRLFCVSGSVARPGVYEMSMGTTLRTLIDRAGGVAAGRQLVAVLLGGAAGTFVTAEELDLPLSFEATRAAGTTLGSGVVMAFDTTSDMRGIVQRIASFFRDESCGQCVPCRIGTVRQEEALHQRTIDVTLVDEIGQVMRDASICGLGQTAASAVQSAIRKLGVR